MDNNFIFGILVGAVVASEIVAALAATYFKDKTNNSRLRHFYIYLWLVVITELIGNYVFQGGASNRLWYTASKILQFNYLLYLFWSYFKTSSLQTIGIIIIASFNLVLIADLFTGSTIYESQPQRAFTLGSLLLSSMIFIFIYEAVRTELVLGMNQYFIVWIAAGLLIYHAVTIPINAIANVIPQISPGNNNLLFIKIGANIMMYGLFIIGCIWSKKKYNF